MYKYKFHTFRPSETIDAVIRLLGRHSLTHAELKKLRWAFDELNGKVVPRPGMTYKIPLPFEAVDDFGEVVPVAEPADPSAEPEVQLVVEEREAPPEPVVEAQPEVKPALPAGMTLTF